MTSLTFLSSCFNDKEESANVALLFVFLHTIVQVGLKINEFILLHVNYMCTMFTLGSSFFPLVQVFAVQYEA